MRDYTKRLLGWMSYRKPVSVFIICPVRGATPEEKKEIGDYVRCLEKIGYKVHWPSRDTDQTDPKGWVILNTNAHALNKADEVHIWWNPSSQGSAFDLGMWFYHASIIVPGVLSDHKDLARTNHKSLVVINGDTLKETEGKSFDNVLLHLSSVPVDRVKKEKPYESDGPEPGPISKPGGNG